MDFSKDIARIESVLAQRNAIEQLGTEEHEMYFTLHDFTLYVGEGSCGFLSLKAQSVLCEGIAFPVPADLTGRPDTQGACYFEYYKEGLNMYDTSEYGQARWKYLESALVTLRNLN